MSRLPVLRLAPVLKAKVWGGQRLLDLAPGQAAGDGPVGEAWLAWPGSRVADGPLAGRTLDEVLADAPTELLGTDWPPSLPPSFPLTVKLLDTSDWLSVQVHPDDAFAQAHEGQPFGKSEAWYVLDAAPGAEIIHGLRQAMAPEPFRRAVEAGALDALLRRVPVRPGEVVFNPPGTIHALGPGIFLYEVQQAADLTYRLYDWDRAAEVGRSLHIDKALAVARPAAAPTPTRPAAQPGDAGGERALLCRAPAFAAVHLRGEGPLDLDTRAAACHVLTVLGGEGLLDAGDGAIPLRRWSTVVVPAAQGRYVLTGGRGGLAAVVAAPLTDSTADTVLPGLGCRPEPAPP